MKQDDNPFRYCGEHFDSETNLIYLRARYYNPDLQRFISEDIHWTPYNMIYGDNPITNGLSGVPSLESIMQANNIYVYCGNNPVKLVDLLGLKAENALIDDKNKAFYGQAFTYDVSSGGFDLKDENIGLGSFEVGFMDAGWEGKYGEISPFKFGTASAGAKIGEDGVYVGAIATAWSPSVTVNVFGFKIKFGVEVISVGAEGYFSNKGYGGGLAALFGATFDISW